MSKLETFVIVLVFTFCVRYNLDGKNTEPKREVLLVKHAFVPMHFNVSNLFAPDPRMLRHNWVRQWFAINTTTIQKASDWIADGTAYVELVSMGIHDKFTRTMQQLIENEPLAVESHYPILVLIETMDFFPVGVFMNVQAYESNRGLTADEARQAVAAIQLMIICNI